MNISELEKEMVLMKIKVYKRVREIKIKRIALHLKELEIKKSLKMIGNFISTKKFY
jgi:hypothetical protein